MEPSMVSAAHQDAYGPAGWGNSPWGAGRYGPANASGGEYAAPPWANRPWAPPFWHPAGMSRPVAIGFTILGFMFWWPVGLALLFYMIGSGRMGCFGRRRRAWQAQNGSPPWADWKNWACGPSAGSNSTSSGNHAFDEYKAETLRRLEEEQKEFGSFLERLRFAKDKAEFDQFMADRRNQPPAPPAQEQPSA
jgi:Protein of unknown function (DUF2852)